MRAGSRWSLEPALRPLCESCQQLPATVDLTWPDGETFHVCAGCTPEGLVAVDLQQQLIEETV